jgi:predicted peptidase
MSNDVNRITWIGFLSFLCLLLAGPGRVRAGAGNAPPEVVVTLDDPQLPASPGYHLIQATARVGERKIPLISGLFLPRVYFQTQTPLPIVMTLHNRGLGHEHGTEGIAFEGLGMMLALDHPDSRGTGEKPAHPVNLRTEAQFIGLIPQCPRGYKWETPPMGRIMAELITQVAKAYHADEDRVYLTGFSYGGSSTWQLALQTPDRYAAIVPLDGRATAEPSQDVLKLKDVAIYLAVGGDDHDFLPESQRMDEALVAAGHSNLVYRIVPGGNHWGYTSIYTDPEFWTWLLAQHRKGEAATQPTAPIAQGPKPAPVLPIALKAGQGVLCQYWRDIPGAVVKDLTDDPAFPRFPNEQVILDRMEIPPNQESNFGTQLSGWLLPPVTGDYTLYIASDDQGLLFLSSDDTPEHLAQVAYVPTWTLPENWTQCPQQQSRPIHLEAGKRYYIEARHKHGGGDSSLAVAWKLPDGTIEGPIPGTRLLAAPKVEVPPPKIVAMEPQELPTTPGIYRLKWDVEYLGHQSPVVVQLVLPRDFSDGGKHPALVFCGDMDQDTRGSRVRGPVRELAGDEPLAAWSPLIVIAPQCPQQRSWEKPWTQQATAAVVEKLLHDLPIDRQRVYLTGAGTGGTALWKLAPLMPDQFAVIAPICAMEVKDPQLPAALAGADVHIVTGVLNGVATDCANRMKDALARLRPAPDVVYEMKMGSEVADAYYSRKDFYQWLLSWRRLPGKIAVRQAPK